MYRIKYIIFVNFQKYLIFGHDILLTIHLNTSQFSLNNPKLTCNKVLEIQVIQVIALEELHALLSKFSKVSEFMPGKLSFAGLELSLSLNPNRQISNFKVQKTMSISPQKPSLLPKR